MVGEGKAEIGITQVSEILPEPGAELAGPLPADIQQYTIFPAAIGAAAAHAEAGQALLKFLQVARSGQGPEGEGAGAGRRMIPKSENFGREPAPQAESASRIRAQLRMPLWNEVRSNFSFGECTRSSSSAKPTISESMPSTHLKSPTIGIEPPAPHDRVLPHSA